MVCNISEYNLLVQMNMKSTLEALDTPTERTDVLRSQ